MRICKTRTAFWLQTFSRMDRGKPRHYVARKAATSVSSLGIRQYCRGRTPYLRSSYKIQRCWFRTGITPVNGPAILVSFGPSQRAKDAWLHTPATVAMPQLSFPTRSPTTVLVLLRPPCGGHGRRPERHQVLRVRARQCTAPSTRRSREAQRG